MITKVQCTFDGDGNLAMAVKADRDDQYPLPVPDGFVSVYVDVETYNGWIATLNAPPIAPVPDPPLPYDWTPPGGGQ